MKLTFDLIIINLSVNWVDREKSEVVKNRPFRATLHPHLTFRKQPPQKQFYTFEVEPSIKNELFVKGWRGSKRVSEGFSGHLERQELGEGSWSSGWSSGSTCVLVVVRLKFILFFHTKVYFWPVSNFQYQCCTEERVLYMGTWFCCFLMISFCLLERFKSKSILVCSEL